jgi:hypothetical protein
MSQALAAYKRDYASKVDSGPRNVNPCLRCLQKVADRRNLDKICCIAGEKAPEGVTHKCNWCQGDHNAECMQVIGPVCARLGYDADSLVAPGKVQDRMGRDSANHRQFAPARGKSHQF